MNSNWTAEDESWLAGFMLGLCGEDPDAPPIMPESLSGHQQGARLGRELLTGKPVGQPKKESTT